MYVFFKHFSDTHTHTSNGQGLTTKFIFSVGIDHWSLTRWSSLSPPIAKKGFSFWQRIQLIMYFFCRGEIIQWRMGRRRAEVVGLALVLLCFPIIVSSAVSACPWGRDPKLTELRAACLCATNVAQQLSIQVSLYTHNHSSSLLTWTWTHAMWVLKKYLYI